MATKIARKTNVQFGANLLAQAGGIAVFGSDAAGSKAYSLDPAVIQSLSNWLNAWPGAVVGADSPNLEDLNAKGFVDSYQIGYILQQGIPEWDPATNYFINGFCSYNGQIYLSLTNSNLNNVPGVSTDWNIVSNYSKGENLIINGSMMVAQRGTSGSVVSGTPSYTLDGWLVSSVGNSTAWAKSLSNNQNFLELTPSGTLTDLAVYQRIESIQMQSIGYTNITIQAQITNNTGATITPTLALKVATAPDNGTYSTTALVATNLQSIANGATAVVAYTYAVTNAYHFEYGMEVIFDFGAQIPSTGSVLIGNVDVSSNPGISAGLTSNPPVFKARPMEVELEICQRYLEPIGDNVSSGSTAVIGSGFLTTTGTNPTNGVINWKFHVRKRAVPSITIPSISNLTAYFGNYVGVAVASLAANNTSVDGTQFGFSMNVTENMLGLGAWIQTNTSTSNPIYASAQL